MFNTDTLETYTKKINALSAKLSYNVITRKAAEEMLAQPGLHPMEQAKALTEYKAAVAETRAILSELVLIAEAAKQPAYTGEIVAKVTSDEAIIQGALKQPKVKKIK